MKDPLQFLDVKHDRLCEARRSTVEESCKEQLHIKTSMRERAYKRRISACDDAITNERKVENYMTELETYPRLHGSRSMSGNNNIQ